MEDSQNMELDRTCDSMQDMGKAITRISAILRKCKDKGEARRCLAAAALTLGVWDLTDDGRIVNAEQKPTEE